MVSRSMRSTSRPIANATAGELTAGATASSGVDRNGKGGGFSATGAGVFDDQSQFARGTNVLGTSVRSRRVSLSHCTTRSLPLIVAVQIALKAATYDHAYLTSRLP